MQACLEILKNGEERPERKPWKMKGENGRTTDEEPQTKNHKRRTTNEEPQKDEKNHKQKKRTWKK